MGMGISLSIIRLMAAVLEVFLAAGLDLAFFIGFEFGVEFRDEANVDVAASLVDDDGSSEFCETILAYMQDRDYDSGVGSIDEPAGWES